MDDALDDYFTWLDKCSPGEVSDVAATGDSSQLAVLADSLDELDGILLSAVEELNSIDQENIKNKNIEEFLKIMWRNTFSFYAAVQEEWMERAFIKRGEAVVATVYSDDEERKRLYQYGFTPFMGRRFEAVFDDIKNVLMLAVEYGDLSANQRFKFFDRLASLVSQDKGFGFSVGESTSAQSILENWNGVLHWWLNIPEAEPPQPDELRQWQRFVAENLEFRLGVAVGATVSRAWSDGVNGELKVPNLENWKNTTGLPWFGFWVRELLRWGTHDPFVAFSLAQGIAKTRVSASEKKIDFEKWLKNECDVVGPDDWINPQFFLKWRASLPKAIRSSEIPLKISVKLTGTDGKLGEYSVLPIRKGDAVIWLDSAGYELAVSDAESWEEQYRSQRFDFKMTVVDGLASVEKTFST